MTIPNLPSLPILPSLGERPGGSEIVPATVRSTSTINYGARTNVTVTAPTGIQNGDLLLATVFAGHTSDINAPTVTPPAGWSEQTQSGILNHGGFSGRVHIYTKTANGESGNYTWTHSAGNSEVFIYCIQNPSDLTIILVNGMGQTSSTGNLSTSEDDTLCLYISGNWQAWAAGGAPSGTTPTLVQRQKDGTHTFYVADASLASPGAFGVRTQSNNNGSGEPWTSTVVLMSPRVQTEVPTLCRFENSTDGTTVTAVILTAGSLGLPPDAAWVMGGTGAANTMKVATGAELDVPGLSYGGGVSTDGGTRGLTVNCGGGLNRYGEIQLTAGGIPKISLGHAIWIPIDYVGTFGTFDLTSMQGNGNFGVCQMFCDAENINIRVHTQAGTGTDIVVTPGTWTWLTLQVDRPSGTCTLEVYNMEGGLSLLGTSTLAFDDGELNDIRSIFLGHIDPHGTTVAADILIDDLAIDVTGENFPLLPVI